MTGGINFGTVPDYEVWPISRLWPGSASFTYESIWGGVTLEGALGVKDGQAPVVAILMGAIVGVGFGSFRVINAGFHPWEMQLFPPGGYPQQWHYQFHARVHYRYTPAGPVIFPEMWWSNLLSLLRELISWLLLPRATQLRPPASCPIKLAAECGGSGPVWVP